VRLNTPSCIYPTKDSTITTTNSEKTGSESNRQVDQTSDSDRETLAAIAEIVAQGDRNTAQLNACIDAYEEVRTKLNQSGRE
jgi:broad-specificity NMP kinase